MATNPTYGTPTALTITLASLAQSATLVTGRESSYVDNSADLALDVLVGGKFTSHATTVADDGIIEVWAYGNWLSTSFGGNASGVDAALTPTPKEAMKLIDTILTDTVVAKTYKWGSRSLVQAFGFMPRYWGIWVTHAGMAGLNSNSANHEIVYIPVKVQK